MVLAEEIKSEQYYPNNHIQENVEEVFLIEYSRLLFKSLPGYVFE